MSREAFLCSLFDEVYVSHDRVELSVLHQPLLNRVPLSDISLLHGQLSILLFLPCQNLARVASLAQPREGPSSSAVAPLGAMLGLAFKVTGQRLLDRTSLLLVVSGWHRRQLQKRWDPLHLVQDWFSVATDGFPQ